MCKRPYTGHMLTLLTALRKCYDKKLNNLDNPDKSPVVTSPSDNEWIYHINHYKAKLTDGKQVMDGQNQLMTLEMN